MVLSLLPPPSSFCHTMYFVVLDVDKHFARFMAAPNKENRHTQCRAFDMNGQTIYGDYVVKVSWQQGSVMANDPRFRVVATSPTMPMVQGANQLKVADYKDNMPKLSRGLALGQAGHLFGQFGNQLQNLGRAITQPCIFPKIF